jgi:hypothetical protein
MTGGGEAGGRTLYGLESGENPALWSLIKIMGMEQVSGVFVERAWAYGIAGATLSGKADKSPTNMRRKQENS